MATMTMRLVIAMLAAIVMLIARCGWLDQGLGVAGVAAGVYAVFWCCVVCGTWWCVCGIEGGASSHASLLQTWLRSYSQRS